jgi:hypothetical protein
MAFTITAKVYDGVIRTEGDFAPLFPGGVERATVESSRALSFGSQEPALSKPFVNFSRRGKLCP